MDTAFYTSTTEIRIEFLSILYYKTYVIIIIVNNYNIFEHLKKRY